MGNKAIYTGLFLDEASQVRLISAMHKIVGPHLWSLKVHHLTLAFKPSREEVMSLPIGDAVEFEAISYGADEKAQAMLCTVPNGLVCTNEYPHITISVAEGVSPVYSNALLTEGSEFLMEFINLTARVGFFDGLDDRFDFNGTIYQ